MLVQVAQVNYFVDVLLYSMRDISLYGYSRESKSVWHIMYLESAHYRGYEE